MNTIFSMVEILKIFRLDKVFSILFGVFTISVYSYGSVSFLKNPSHALNLTVSLFSLLFLMSGGYAMNDYCDYEYDLINHPQTLLVNRILSRKKIKFIFLILFVLGLILALNVNRYFFMMIVFNTLMLLFYNLFSKRLYYFKSIIIAFIVVTIYPLSIALTLGGNPSLRRDSLSIFPFWLFCIIISYELSQDIIDIKGDIKGGGRTLPMKIGVKNTKYLATLFGLLSIPIVLIPYFHHMCGIVYFTGLVITLPFYVISIFSEEKKFSTGSLWFVRIVTLISFIDIIVASNGIKFL
ncbi:MAG: UbiA family prenyltransferase [bacterium]